MSHLKLPKILSQNGFAMFHVGNGVATCVCLDDHDQQNFPYDLKFGIHKSHLE